MHNELGQELERRGLRFGWRADDGSIHFRNWRCLIRRRKLPGNQQKSAVARPWERKFPVFRFPNGRQPKGRTAPQAVARFEGWIRELTCRFRGVSIERMAEELTP